MKIRKILRDFINWQGSKDLLKNELTIDYELAETYLEDQTQVNLLPICDVIDSCRFNRDDLLRAYQAGCIEGQDDCVDFSYDDLKETIQDSEKWYKRYTDKGN